MFRHSEVTTTIDDTDTSILSNITNVTMASLFAPTLNSSVGYNVYYNNALYNPHSGHNASSGGVIGSSGFKVGSDTNEMFFDDDGAGNLRRYHLVGVTRTYDDTTAGTVNYTTGAITINAITISSISNVDGLSSTKIRITGIPNSKDVVPVRNQILELDMVNIKVTGEIDTIAVGDTGASSTYTTASSSPSNTSY